MWIIKGKFYMFLRRLSCSTISRTYYAYKLSSNIMAYVILNYNICIADSETKELLGWIDFELISHFLES